jgi:hypothetical protein
VSTHAILAPPRQVTRSVPRLLGLAAAAVIIALVPVIFGLALLVSALARRPLIPAMLRRWPRLAGLTPPADPARLDPAAARMTVTWGVVLLATGLLQGIGAIAAGLSVTNPAGIAIRTLFALIVLVTMAVRTVGYLRRSATSGSD